MQRLSMSYYDRQQTGPLISTITDDVNAVQNFISTSLLDLLIDSLTIVGMLAVMFALNWSFTLIALAVTPLLALFVYRLRTVIKEAQRNVRRRQSELVTIVQEGLGSMRVVKAFAQGRFERERLGAKSVESVEAALYARRVRSLLNPVVTILVAVGTAAVLWFGAQLVMTDAMTAGSLVVFITYIGRLFRPVQNLARASTNIAQAAIGLERIRAVLDSDERLPRAADAQALERVEGRVAFSGVDFAYVPGRPVLTGISFVAEPGQLIGLVGPSGLSGGQRQRIGIARAMVRDARILIMDEPGAGLDAESERLVFEALRTLLAGRTTFVIAHNFAKVRNADMILVLDQGRIVERGTHEKLLELKGLYSRLQAVQEPDVVRLLEA